MRRAIGMNRAVGMQRALGMDRVVGVPLPSGPNTTGLKPYQREGVFWLRDHKRGLLGDEMALGKSVQALRALDQHSKTIVAGPASSEITWEVEVAKWRPDLRFTSGDLRKPRRNEVLFVSIDSLPEPPPGSYKLVHEPMLDVTLIIDECHYVKNYTAKRTVRARMLGRQCGRVWGLTGTPMPGKPEDLWGLLGSLGLAYQVCPDGWDEFVHLCSGKKRYCRDRRTGALKQIGYIWGDISDEIRERLQAVMLRRLRSDVYTDMPKVQYLDVPVALSVDGIALLDEAKQRWDALGLDPHELPPFEMMSEARAALARSRIKPALEWADACASPTMQLLVFSAHEEPITAMRELDGAGAFTGATPRGERKRLVQAFKAGELRILAMTIQTGGVSLNLQEAGAILYVDRSYTPGDNTQADARVLRPGQKHPSVLIARMTSTHPLDVRVQEILDEKEPRIAAMVGA